MRKIIGIFLAMVFGFVFVSISFADNGIAYGKDEWDVCYMIRDWAEQQGYENWASDRPLAINGVGYACGTLNLDSWEQESDCEWTVDNFEKWLGEEWEVCEAHTKVIGVVEGINVYMTETQSETKIAGTGYNPETDEVEDCYCASVIYAVWTSNPNEENITTWDNVPIQSW